MIYKLVMELHTKEQVFEDGSLLEDVVKEAVEIREDFKVKVSAGRDYEAEEKVKDLKVEKGLKEQKQPLTKEQFLAQFPCEVDVKDLLAKDVLRFDGELTILAPDGVKVFRALNKILVKVNGKFYASDK